MKTILVLTDFSLKADHAAHYALKLAQKIKANLLLCNVFLVPSNTAMAGQIAWPMEDYETLGENSNHDLSELASRLNRNLDNEIKDGELRPAIDQYSKSGFVADTINEIASNHHVLMAVISMHGSNGLSSFFLDNHASEVIEKANCPVLLIPYQVQFKEFKKIGFASDLTHSDIDVLHSLAGLAKFSNSEILITHVTDETASTHEDPHIINNFLKLVSSMINYPRIYYREIKGKSVTKSLDWLSDNTDIDMLVLVHRKKTFFQSIFEKSVTQKLAKHFTKPLLVFPYAKVRETFPVF